MPYAQEIQDFIDRYPALKAIGNTPLVKLDIPIELGDIGEASIYAKYEQLNPGGSIKDRPVLRMLAQAIIEGKLTPDQTILDATSGNAGIAYAMIGAVLGYEVELVMPENASEERKKRLVAHGANLVFTDAQKGYDEALYEVKRRYESDPDKYFYCDQYSNFNNPLAHYETTAAELLEQAPFITHFVGGVGTGGTISGIGRRLKESNASIQVVCIDFDEWPGVEGLKPLSEGHIIPKTFDRSVVDRMLEIDVLQAYDVSRLMARMGIFTGQSSGAYLLGAKIVAEEAQLGHVVTIFNDIGERYFSTSMWG
ncbi:MAG: PLP-dependent cysteine synthase family protein [SAR202 cluster bacterium]|nr:PLP-dependent cysteine synthase family protein [SAR202 cluster bacterium]HAE33177.1 cysteine synthase [Dehalococcoidia bacterium]